MEWFETYARKAVARMFQGQNQNNWDSLINAFALGMRDYKKKTNKDMVLILENADNIFEVDDSGNTWAVAIVDRAQCGKFIFLSKKKLSAQKTGKQTLSLGIENFTPEDSFYYFNSIGIDREAIIDTIYDNTHGNPALMSYCIETSDFMADETGLEPTPLIYFSLILRASYICT